MAQKQPDEVGIDPKDTADTTSQSDESSERVFLSRRWWILASRGFVALAFGLGLSVGIVLALWDALTPVILLLLFGAYTFIDGIFAVISAIDTETRTVRSRYFLLEGIVGTGIGILAPVLAVSVAMSLGTLVAVVGSWAILTGGLEFFAAASVNQSASRDILRLSGLASVVFGTVVFITFLTGLAAPGLVGVIVVYTVVVGVLFPLVGFRVRYLQTADSWPDWSPQFDLSQLDKQLYSAIDIYRVRLSQWDERLKTAPTKYAEARQTIRTARKFLNRANRSLRNRDSLSALKYFYEAQEDIPVIYSALDEARGEPSAGRLESLANNLVSRTEALLGEEEASKLRGKYFTAKEPPTLKEDVSPDSFRGPLKRVSGTLISEYESLLVLRRMLWWFNGLLAMLLLAFFAALFLDVVPLDNIVGRPTESSPATPPSPLLYENVFFLVVVLLGFLGATVSNVLKWAEFSLQLGGTSSSLPSSSLQMSIALELTIGRILVGGMAAVFFFIVLMSGVVDSLFAEITTGLALTTAFVAGFSDRVLLSTVDSLVERITSQQTGAGKDVQSGVPK